MHNVSQEFAANEMPLAGAETTRFWRDGRFGAMECLSATFLTHVYAPHAHDTFSIGAIEKGSQRNRIRGCRSCSQPGDLYLINPGVVHDGSPFEGGYSYRMIYPGEEICREIIEDVTGRAFHGYPAFSGNIIRDEALVRAFYQAHRMLEFGCDLEGQESMFMLLASMFCRYGDRIVRPREMPRRNAVGRARDYLNDNFDSDVSLIELAAIAGLSRAHLIRAFRKEFHITPHSFLTDVRIRQARRLLAAGATPATVALDCGFADQAHFTRHFKARTGITPGQFRAA